MTRIHATAVLVRGRGLLLLGGSGVGKSDLALRLVDRGAMLVGDDQLHVTLENDYINAEPAPLLTGLLEVRGVGIVRLPYSPSARLALALDLGRPPERMPEPDRYELGGVTIPLIGFNPFTASAALRAELALSHFAPPPAPE